MARKNDATELYRRITSIDLYRVATGTIGDTTLSSNLATGASVVPVTAITNFANGDPVFIIGDGGLELNQINGTTNVSMPVKYKTLLAQTSGARFVEAVQVPLG